MAKAYAGRYDAEYLTGLNHGNNIGVLLGKPSEGLCTIDVDDDDELEAFLGLNPEFHDSLISRGARGGNVWLRIKGHYPQAARLSLVGSRWGEWRADRNQTVFFGRHQSGCDYTNNGKRPLTIAFESIRWPKGLSLPWQVQEPPQEVPNGHYTANDAGRAERFVDRFQKDV
jgi:hypothetical protein